MLSAVDGSNRGEQQTVFSKAPINLTRPLLTTQGHGCCMLPWSFTHCSSSVLLSSCLMLIFCCNMLLVDIGLYVVYFSFACVRMRTHPHTHTHSCTHNCTHSCIHTCTHMRTHTSTHSCIHTCTHSCIHASTHVHSQLHTHMHTHAHTVAHSVAYTQAHMYTHSCWPGLDACIT